MNTRLIKSILLLFMGTIFLSIGHFVFNDNYSIETLIQTFQLYGGDILTYKIKVNQGDDKKECVIKGNYADQILTIDSIEDMKGSTKPNFDKFHKNCNEIKTNTNLKFIGDFEEGSLTKKVDVDYAVL